MVIIESIRNNEWLQEKFLKRPYSVHALLYLIFIIQGFIYDTPRGIAQGLWYIIVLPDILITDYIVVGGIGAAFVNIGLAGLISLVPLAVSKHEPTGLTIGTLGVVIGMAFFGKNPINMLPIIFGGYLHSVYAKVPFKNCVVPTLLATCLTPAVTQLAFIEHVPLWFGLILGMTIGLFIGFIMVPASAHMRKAHEGYNIYNVGFTAGLLGVMLFALFRHFGVDFYILYIWSEGYNTELTIFLIILSFYFVICGVLCKAEELTVKELVKIDADDNDYFKRYAEKS